MDSGDNPVAGCLILLICIVINGMFYSFGSAIQNLNEGEVERKAEDGDGKSQLLYRLLQRPGDLINTIHLLATLLSTLYGLLFMAEAIDNLVAILQKTPAGQWLRDGWMYGTAGILVFLMYLILLAGLGVFMPKKVGMHYPEGVAYHLVRPIRLVILLFYPLTRLITGVSNLVVRLFGIDPTHEGEDVTEDEIIDLVDEAHEQGVIEESEAEMIQNIMEFGDKEAQDIMIHRKNINILEDQMTLSDAISYMVAHRNSRYPVCHEDMDNIIGFIHIRDAMACQMEEGNQEKTLKQIPRLIRTVAYIPETRSIDRIFQSMQKKKIHMAIVVDEYGQTAGLVTMEDILEEIVGNILDEYDESEEYIQPQFDESLLMDGLTPLDDVEKTLDIDLGDHEVETLNGYLTSLLGHIPTGEDHEIHANGYNFQILVVENNIIQKVRVEKCN